MIGRLRVWLAVPAAASITQISEGWGRGAMGLGNEAFDYNWHGHLSICSVCAREDAVAHSNTDDVFNNGRREILRMKSYYSKMSAAIVNEQ